MEINKVGETTLIGEKTDTIFENRQTLKDDLTMIEMLEQLRRDILADIERRKYAYIGKDGKDYHDKESLDLANKRYIEGIYRFIGKDGKEYSTLDGLESANKAYNGMIFPKQQDKLFYPDPISRDEKYYDHLGDSYKTR